MKNNPQSNLKFISYLLLSITLTLGFSISLQSLLAAWTAPTATPPGVNVAEPINTSSITQNKQGNLTSSSSIAVDWGLLAKENLTALGNATIGLLAFPKSLKVYGNIQITGGSPGVGKVLTATDVNGNTAWQTPATLTEVDGIIGNEVSTSTNLTLVRSGLGTTVSPYTLGLNLANANTWTGAQTFNGVTTMGAALNMNYANAEINHQLDNNFFINSNEGMQFHFNSGGGTGTLGINNSANNQVLTVLDSGNVGIGTMNPTSRLHLAGGTFNIDNNDDIRPDFLFSMRGLMVAESSMYINIDPNNESGETKGFYVGKNSNVIAGTENLFTVLETGNVGIGVTSPAAKLDINGQIRIRGGNPAMNRVLTSSADGTATWSDVVGGNGITVAGLNISTNATTCLAGQYSRWNGTSWVCADDISGGSYSSWDLYEDGVHRDYISDSEVIGFNSGSGITVSFLDPNLTFTADTAYLQRRAGANCAVGQYAYGIGADGVLACRNDVTGGVGTITGVTAGNGLTGGGTTGAVTLNVVGGTGITANADNILLDTAYTDGRYINTAGGDTMTGTLTLSGGNINMSNTNHILDVVTMTVQNITRPGSDNNNINFGDPISVSKVTNLATPSAASDAANRGYVDSAISHSTLTGTQSISSLTIGKKYLVTVYGISKNRGSGDYTLGAVMVRNTVACGGTLYASTPTATINWPDGHFPQSASFIITPTSGTIYGYVDSYSSSDYTYATYMTAVQLN